MSKQHWTLSKGRHFTIESFDIVAVCANKVECCLDKVERSFDNVACCFDIVAGVDGALELSRPTSNDGGGPQRQSPDRRSGQSKMELFR